MRTVITVNRKTWQTSVEVQGAVGGECRTKNATLYERLQRGLGLQFQETPKPEMELTETETLTNS
jgi:hypothetical protein